MAVSGSVERERLVLLCAAAVVAVLGYGLRELEDGPVAEDGGTALFGVLIYLLVGVFGVRWRLLVVAADAIGLCWLVEFGQLTPVPAEAARWSPVSRLVLGSTFSVIDLVWYVVGVVAAVCLHWTVRRSHRYLSVRGSR